jgi:4-hydroxybenzoate polyprenyltransferase
VSNGVNSRSLVLAVALAQLGRLEILPMTIMPFAVGVSVSHAHLSMERLALLGTYAVTLHLGACSLNELADARTDGMEPGRRANPVSRGIVGTRLAWILSLSMMAFAVLAALLLFASSTLGLLLGLGTLTAAGYTNFFQKCFGWPHAIVSDVIFGITVGMPIILVQFVSRGSTLDAFALALAPVLAVLCTTLNVVAGNTKDLCHDIAVNSHTTARDVGVTQEVPGGMLLVANGYRHILRTLIVIDTLVIAAACVGMILTVGGMLSYLCLPIAIGIETVAAIGGWRAIAKRSSTQIQLTRYFVVPGIASFFLMTLVAAPVWAVAFAASSIAWLRESRRFLYGTDTGSNVDSAQ